MVLLGDFFVESSIVAKITDSVLFFDSVFGALAADFGSTVATFLVLVKFSEENEFVPVVFCDTFQIFCVKFAFTNHAEFVALFPVFLFENFHVFGCYLCEM